MPVEIIITDSKFYNEFKNGVGFGSNPSDFTTNLAGSIMERMKIIYQVDVTSFFQSYASRGDGLAGVQELSPGVLELSRNPGKKWRDDGFAIGDTVVIRWADATSSGPTRNQDATVTSITNEFMILSWPGYPGGGTPASRGWINNATIVFNTSPLTAMKWRFGLNDNNLQAVDFQSAVSGTDQGYYGSNIGFDTGGGVRDTNFQNFQRLGVPQGWVTGNCRARFVQDTAFVFGRPVTQRFIIEHEFTIVPFYLDGELTNLQNNIIPNILAGQNSIKYGFDVEFLRVLNNQNTAKRATYYDTLGDVAWFNESFNGTQNNYQVNSITYTEQPTGNPANGLLVASKTRVQMQVQKNNGNFVVGERVGVYVSYLPEEVEYQNTPLTDLDENFLYDNAMGNASASGINGQYFITNLTTFSPTGNLMTLFFDVEYTTAQKQRLLNKATTDPILYLIGVELGDVTIPSGNSDRIIILADAREYDDSADIPNLMNVTKYDIYPHNKQIGVDFGFTDLTGWNEDGVVIDFTFGLNLLQQAFINTLEFKWLAYNTVTGDYFELDSYSIPNVATSPVSGGVQQLAENTTRGYPLATGDQFNDVILTTGVLMAGTQFYNGRIAQKVSWQDWIQNLNVNNVFFNGAKPNDNKNLRSSNYSNLNDYTLRFGIFANLDGVNTFNVAGNTDYLFISPNITIFDYDLDANITPDWVGTIETFHPTTLVNLNGALLIGTDTLMRTTWVPSGAPVVSVADMWAIHRVEETNQNGYAIDELSTINPYPTGNKPIPLATETQLKIDPISGNVVTECLVDGSLIQTGTQYNLSSRLHEENPDVPVDGKITEQSVLKETEAAVTKIIE